MKKAVIFHDHGLLAPLARLERTTFRLGERTCTYQSVFNRTDNAGNIVYSKRNETNQYI